jgi:hypothetical protein
MKNIYLALFLASISMHFEFKYGATMMVASILIIITQINLYIHEYNNKKKSRKTCIKTEKKNDIIQHQPRTYWKNRIAETETEWRITK